MTLYVTVTNCHTIQLSITQSHNTKEDSRRFWKNKYHIAYYIHVDLKTNTWLFRVG